MHKYNNQDHSMMTAIFAARNVCGANYDLWAVNTEPEYHEETKGQASSSTKRPAYAEPTRLTPKNRDQIRCTCTIRRLRELGGFDVTTARVCSSAVE